MNDELFNDQNNSDNEAQIDDCAVCKKNPCVCLYKPDETSSEAASVNSLNDEDTKTKPPKISWI